MPLCLNLTSNSSEVDQELGNGNTALTVLAVVGTSQDWVCIFLPATVAVNVICGLPS
nr:MAG TPA: hypothetical protein [Caudoviricetes sp.]